MDQFLSEISIQTSGKEFVNISSEIKRWVIENSIKNGILILFLKHTSCSLIINENADPRVLKDLSNYMQSIVPEEGFKPISGMGKMRSYLHADEGKDDMPAHIRTSLTSTSLALSIQNQQIELGTWQAIYLWEHRSSSHIRKLNLHAIGEKLE